MTFEVGDRVRWDDHIGVLLDEWIGTVVETVPDATRVHWDGCDAPEVVFYMSTQLRPLETTIILRVEDSP